MQPDRQSVKIEDRANIWYWLGPLFYMLVVGYYATVRYMGNWAENDSAAFTHWIRKLTADGQLVPLGGGIYPNGYAYQAISTYVASTTGLSPAVLQQLMYPLIACIVVLPAWIFYREFTGSQQGATLTTILLFTQPEFLFVILRSSHEKFTRTFMLLCLFLLVRSFTLSDKPRFFAVYIGLFYLIIYAFILSNNMLAYSFIFAIVIALIFNWLLEKRVLTLHNAYISRRLCYVMIVSIGFVYLFTFYIYPPAQHDLVVLKDTWEQIKALFLSTQNSTETTYTNAYRYVSFSWTSLPIYFLVSIANWIIFIVSFTIWIYQGLRWLWRGIAPDNQSARFLWILYTAFAIQGTLSVVADASGALGSNLQHRLFPSFSIIAVGMVGAVLGRWRPRHFEKPVWVGISVAIFCVSILSVMKATNEPIISNKWIFYRQGEMAALRWSDSHLRYAEVGTEFDERLWAAFRTEEGSSRNQNRFLSYRMTSTMRDFLLSSVTRLRSSRVQLPLPVPPDALRVYDNGEAELYHLRPKTPFQR